MATEKITSQSVERLRKDAVTRGVGLYLWDTELRGFGCRSTSKGHVSWLFQHWVGGKGGRPSRMVFGDFPATKLDQARKYAEKLRGDVNAGVDVVSRKVQRRDAMRADLQATKLKAAWELYVARKGTDSTHWEWANAKVSGEVFDALGATTAVKDIDKTAIVSLIDKIEAKHPISARYTFAVLRPFFKWCVGRQYIALSPMENLAAPSLPKARDRILSDDEIKSFWKATDTSCQGMYLWGPFYRLLMLTAQRREEVGGIRWSEVDLDKAVWTIPSERTKNGKAHIVHLSPLAVVTLKSLTRANSEYIFTTTLKAPISGYGRAKKRLDGLTEIKDWVVHDIRRTAASGMAKLGFQPHIIERVLNHVSGAQGGLVAVYQRYEYLEERRRAIEAWGTYVDGLIADKPMAENVVPIRAWWENRRGQTNRAETE